MTGQRAPTMKPTTAVTNTWRAPPNPWVAFHTPRASPAVRLFCFPFAGGSAGAYRTWGTALPESIEVLPVELPGRGLRMQETPLAEWPALLSALAEGLEPLLTSPFAFFGYSMGAKIAYELARTLRRAGRPGPTHLFLSAGSAPHLPKRGPDRYHLPRPAFLAEIVKMGGTRPEVLADPDLVEMFLPCLRADFKLMDQYTCVPEERLDCPFICFRGSSDRTVPPEEVEPWREHTRGGFRMETYHGEGHFFLEQRRQQIFDVLCAELLGAKAVGFEGEAA